MPSLGYFLVHFLIKFEFYDKKKINMARCEAK